MDILGGRRGESAPEADVQEPVIKHIVHKENLHSYICFVPLVLKRKHGTYCNSSLFVALAIFSCNIVLQLSLTLLAGDFIIGENSDFFDSLIAGSSVDGSGQLWEGYHALVDPVKIWAGAAEIKINNRFNSNSSSSCCTGPACSQENECCAPDRPVKDSPALATGTGELSEADADFLTDAALLEAHKPRGKATTKRGKGDKGIVRNERAVCTLENGTLDCSPPSSAFAAHWSELDVDGDGRWTHEEAMADTQNLGCRLGVSAEEVFRHACRGIVADAEDSARVLSEGRKSRSTARLPAELVERRAITLDYFNWWRGLVAICVHIDAARCGELVQEGLFEGAMDPELKGSRGGVVDLDSAFEYCTRILRPGGLCDVVLPGTFLMFRDRVQEACGEKSEGVGPRLTNPFREADAMHIRVVSYQNMAEYSNMHTKTFRFFLFLVLIMWYLRLIDEFKDSFEFFDFVWNFPSNCEDESNEGKTRSGSLESGSPEGTDASHAPGSRRYRFIIAGSTLVRFWLVVYLANIGTVYLLSTHSPLDLMLNAVALAFIFEIPEFVYVFLVADDVKKEVEELEPFSFPTSMPQGGIVRLFGSKAFFGLFVIPAMSLLVVVYNDVYRTQPVVEGLQCTCNLSGERCHHVGRFPKTWWDSHWVEVSSLDHRPVAVLLANASVILNESTLWQPLPSWESETKGLTQDDLLPWLSNDANSTTQVDAAAMLHSLLQTKETQKPLSTSTRATSEDSTMRVVEEHVANGAGLLQLEHVREHAPARVHDVSEL